MLWTLAVALAGPADDIDALLGVVEETTVGTCSANLDRVFRELEALDASRVPADEVRADAPVLVERAFEARLKLHQSLGEWKFPSDRCITGVRRVDLALRYLMDELLLVMEPGDRPQWLTNAAYSFSDPLRHIRAGDVLVTRGNAMSSAGIAHMGRIDAQFSHNALVHADDKGRLWTVEAYLESGALVQPLEKFLAHGLGRIVVLRYEDVGFAAEATKKAFHRVRSGDDIDYDADFDFEDHSALFCSEVARWAWKENGGPAVPERLSVFDHDRNGRLFEEMGVETAVTSAPADMLFDPRFDIVAEWRDLDALRSMQAHDAVVESMFSWMEEKNYVIEPTGADRSTVSFGLFMRRLGFFRKRLHPHGDKQFLVASLALQNAANEVHELYVEAVAGQGRLAYAEQRVVLEEIRQADLERFEAGKGGRSAFHGWLHPGPGGVPEPPPPTLDEEVERFLDQLVLAPPIDALDDHDGFAKWLAAVGERFVVLDAFEVSVRVEDAGAVRAALQAAFAEHHGAEIATFASTVDAHGFPFGPDWAVEAQRAAVRLSVLSDEAVLSEARLALEKQGYEGPETDLERLAPPDE